MTTKKATKPKGGLDCPNCEFHVEAPAEIPVGRAEGRVYSMLRDFGGVLEKGAMVAMRFGLSTYAPLKRMIHNFRPVPS
jgi:hypothetical protein